MYFQYEKPSSDLSLGEWTILALLCQKRTYEVTLPQAKYKSTVVTEDSLQNVNF
jgi:hypothetical protein